MPATYRPTNASTLHTAQVPHDVFQHHIADARAASLTIRDATSPSEDYPRFGATYYLTRDRLSGYGVTNAGHLTGLFSLVRGRGASLVAAAIEDGARTLDCFDGFLTEFYALHGFVETHRSANWDGEDEPDIVWMKLAKCENRCDDGFIETVGGYGGGPGRCGLCNHPAENP